MGRKYWHLAPVLAYMMLRKPQITSKESLLALLFSKLLLGWDWHDLQCRCQQRAIRHLYQDFTVKYESKHVWLLHMIYRFKGGQQVYFTNIVLETQIIEMTYQLSTQQKYSNNRHYQHLIIYLNFSYTCDVLFVVHKLAELSM